MAGASIADNADGADEPIARARRAADHEIVGDAVIDDAVGAFPAVAGAGFASVLGVEVVAVNGDVVPDRRGGPAMVGAGLGMGVVAHAVHKHIGAGGEGLGDELVPVLPRITIPDEAQRVIVHDEGITAAACDD